MSPTLQVSLGGQAVFNGSKGVQHFSTTQSAIKAQEVFSTPELLEEIMMYLPSREKLRAMEVQRCWRDVLIGSVRLKRSLGLAPSKIYYSAFSPRFDNTERPSCRCCRDKLPNSYCPIGLFEDRDHINTKVNRYRLPNAAHSTELGPVDSSMLIRIVCDSTTSLVFGSRIRKMMLTSGPPLRELAQYRCCNLCKQMRRPFFEGPIRCRSIVSESPSGFTIGELADRIAELRAKHPNCDGFIELWGVICLDSDDPIMIKRQQAYDRKLARRIQPTKVDDSNSESSDDSDSSDGNDEEDGGSEDGSQEGESDSGDESVGEEEQEHGGTSDGDEDMREFSDDEEHEAKMSREL